MRGSEHTRGAREPNTLFVTENHRDVTVSNRGGRPGTPETVLDLQSPTDVEYHFPPARQLRGRGGLRIRMQLYDTDGNLLPDDTTIRMIVQSPVEEDENQVGTTRTLRQFNSVNQYDSDEVFTLDINKRYELTEDAHFKIQIDSSVAVDWSADQTWVELETIRKS